MAIPFTMPSEPVDELIRIVLLIQQAAYKQPHQNHHLLKEIIKFLLKELEKKLCCSVYDDQLKEALDMIRHGLIALAVPPENQIRIRVSANYSNNKLDQIDPKQDCKRVGPIRGVPPTDNSPRRNDFKYPSFDVIEEDGVYNRKEETPANRNLLVGATCAIWRVIFKPARKLFWTAIRAVPILCVVGWTLAYTSSNNM